MLRFEINKSTTILHVLRACEQVLRVVVEKERLYAHGNIMYIKLCRVVGVHNQEL